jgi:penicillin amidase
LEVAAQEVLRSWDARMDVDSAGAAIYASCRLELLRAVVATLGLDRDRVGHLDVGPSLLQTVRLLWSRSAAFPDGLTDLDLAGIGGWHGAWATALRWGVRSLEARFGADPSRWRWGDLHRTRFVHPLGGAVPEEVEVGGDAECVRASGPAPPDLGAIAASVARYVFDLSDWDNSRWIVPHGVSGRPTSPHFADQLADWASPEVRLRPMRYSCEAIDAATESTTTLTPS